MSKRTVSRNVGERRDLEVRAGNDLTPQMFFLKLSSGQTLNAANTELVCRIFAQESDTVPLVTPAFDVEELATSVGGDPRVLMTLPAAKVAELLALPLPPAQARLRAVGVRTFWWTCSFQDSAGALRSLFYGSLRILKGAARA